MSASDRPALATAAPDTPGMSHDNAGHPSPTSQALRLARKTQSLDILYEVATVLSQPGGLEQLLEHFLDLFIELVDARAASVRLVTTDGHTRLIASKGLAPAVIERDRLMPLGACSCGWAVSEDRLRTQTCASQCAEVTGGAMLEKGCAEFVAIPVRYQDRILGVYNLFLDRPLGAMGEDMPDLLITVGRHLGLAFEKSRLEVESRRLAIMDERHIIGNELHDSLAQSLIGMHLQLKLLSESLAREDLAGARFEVNKLRRAMVQANSDLRELLNNYRLKLDDAGLAQTIAGMVERFSQESGIAVFFQNECQALSLTPAQEVQVFYIIHEALANIRKHSQASNVRIMFNNEDDLYIVLIEDDGVGMTGEVGGLPGEHAGLAIMRERAERLKGQIVIESEPGEGVRVVLMFNAPPPSQMAVAPPER